LGPKERKKQESRRTGIIVGFVNYYQETGETCSTHEANDKFITTFRRRT
jgi:hypothetical protein